MNFEDASQLWQKALSVLRNEMSPVRFQTWFEKLKLYSAENGKIILYTEDQFVVRHLREHFMTQLSLVVTNVFGDPYDVEVVIKDDLSKYEKKAQSSKLNPNYTFETFVVGQSNRFAHAACLAVAENPGEAYNPLFIYGGVGLGKTHLMNAISHYILANSPDSTILLTTSENFTNEVVDAIAHKKTQELRNKMRNVDVLLIDDVQFLSNKQATQEEFFHTFNALFQNGKQIVLSSDRPPQEIETLAERMRSRFMSGLVADIHKPDLETRMAILSRMAEAKGIKMDIEAIQYIAENVNLGIREMEGSMYQVLAYSKAEKSSITRELAVRALKDFVKVSEEKPITAERIIDEVALKYRVKREDIMSDKRSRDISIPRQIAIYLTRELAGLSTTRIGTAFGRDHSTIMHACRKISDDIKTNSEVSRAVSDITRAIKEG